MAKEKVLLSACLGGVNCVYDGSNKRHPIFVHMAKDKKAVLFCPEVFGGLKIPHSPSEIKGGDGFSVLAGEARVLSKEGKDVTETFLKGAKGALSLAKRLRLGKAILKSKSPSCGCGWIYDGTFSKKLIAGYGVAAALLKQNDIAVLSDVDYLKNRRRRSKSRKRKNV